MEIFKLFGSVFIDDKEANKSLSKIEKKTGNFSEKLGKGIKTAGKFGAGIAAGAGVAAGGLTALANKTAEYADDIDKTSMKMGTSKKALQEWRYVAGQVGVSQEQMDKGLERLNQRVGMAANGNKKYSDALAQLGFSQDEIKNGTVSTDEAMMRSIDTLNKMESSSEKSALAQELFGTKMARDLMPAIEAGTVSIEDLRKEANDMGMVMGDKAIKSSVKYADTVDKLKNTFGGLSRQIGTAVMPIIQSFLDWILKHMPQIKSTVKTVFSVIGKVVRGFIDVIQLTIKWLKDMFSGNKETLEGMKDKFMEIMPKLREFAENAFKKIIDVAKTMYGFWKDNLLPIYKNLFEWIRSYMPQVRDIATKVFQKVIDIVKIAWGIFKNDLLPILAGFYSTIRENLPQIKKIFESVFDIIFKVIKTVWDLLDASLIPIIKFLWEKVVKPLLPKLGTVIEETFNIAIDVIEKTIDAFEKVIGWIEKGLDKLTFWNNTDAEEKTLKINEESHYTDSKGRPKRYATGTNFAPGGMALVGEQGAELVELPRGSKVHTNQQTKDMLGGSTVNNNYVTISAKDVKEFNDVTNFFNQLPQTVKANT